MQLLVIGIGMSSPAHLTAEAAAAIAGCNLFLVPDKGPTTHDLVEARRQLVESVRGQQGYRFVTVPDPERPSDGDPVPPRYRRGVADWRRARAEAFAAELSASPEIDSVGLLAWGDPAFYDSTIEMARDIARLVPADVRVIPGLSAFQVLAARAGVGLNLIGGPVHITPGRHLLQDYRADMGTVVVMLDSYLVVAELAPSYPDAVILWGANLGLADETIITGRLGDVIEQITAARSRIHQTHGWVMDTYALWPPGSSVPPYSKDSHHAHL